MERPDEPDPRVGRHLCGDGEGEGDRGEERQAGRRGVRKERRRGKQKDYCPTWLSSYENWDGDLYLENEEDYSDAISEFNYFCWQGRGGIKKAPSLPGPGTLQPVSSAYNKNVFLGPSASFNLLSACFPPTLISNLYSIEETPRYDKTNLI